MRATQRSGRAAGQRDKVASSRGAGAKSVVDTHRGRGECGNACNVMLPALDLPVCRLLAPIFRGSGGTLRDITQLRALLTNREQALCRAASRGLLPRPPLRGRGESGATRRACLVPDSPRRRRRTNALPSPAERGRGRGRGLPTQLHFRCNKPERRPLLAPVHPPKPMPRLVWPVAHQMPHTDAIAARRIVKRDAAVVRRIE
jgi:hypothetical protein